LWRLAAEIAQRQDGATDGATRGTPISSLLRAKMNLPCTGASAAGPLTSVWPQIIDGTGSILPQTQHQLTIPLGETSTGQASPVAEGKPRDLPHRWEKGILDMHRTHIYY
jgi:hypothetical protein